MKPVVLLDMDGVIADFFTAVCELYGQDLKEYKAKMPWEYAVHKWISEIANPEKPYTLTYKHTAKSIDSESGFWYKIPKYPWTNQLASMLFSIDFDIYICSSPSIHKRACDEKLMWLNFHTPHFTINHSFVFTNHKYLLAKPHHILIDDSDEVVDKFRAHGGRTILFPQPWNTCFSIIPNRIEYIQQELKRHLYEIQNNQANTQK